MSDSNDSLFINALIRDSVDDNANAAKSVFARITKLISDFEKDLPKDKQAGISVPALNNVSVFLDSISYWNPDIIVFYGHLLDGSSTQLIQHISQLNIVLFTMPREEKTLSRRTIGFITDKLPSD